LWAERFDRTLEDVFSVQDEVTAKIVEALIGRLTAPTPRKRPENFEAYDLCVRARVLTEESPQTAREAYLLLKRAIELEPAYAEAHGLLGYNRWLAWTHFGEPEDPNRSLAVELAERAVRYWRTRGDGMNRMANSVWRWNAIRTTPIPGRRCRTCRS
jgi:adenylate cyclase